jgi:hypothetical protein
MKLSLASILGLGLLLPAVALAKTYIIGFKDEVSAQATSQALQTIASEHKGKVLLSYDIMNAHVIGIILFLWLGDLACMCHSYQVHKTFLNLRRKRLEKWRV